MALNAHPDARGLTVIRPTPSEPVGRVDLPFAIRGASLGFSVLLIGILLSTVVSVAKPAVGLALSSVPYVLAFFLAARRTGAATAPALHGVVAATVAYALVLPLILRDPAGRNMTQIAFTTALAVSVGALTGWLTSRD